MNDQVLIYDTTLRDGSQAEGITLSKSDKLRIAERLDRLGVAYIEGGWPGSNPKDVEFFKEVKKLNLKHAKIAAFGSTRRAKNSPEEDENLKLLLESESPVVTIFGKSWLLHVTEVLRVTPEQNLEMIQDSCAYLSAAGRETIFDAEHFFDGYKDAPEYALDVLKHAVAGGASTVTLCDTNGGCLPEEIYEITRKVRETLPENVVIGIHCHNDSELATANSLAAVRAGARHIQGTINGFGERSGNANLCSIIANVELKMKMQCLPEGNLATLRDCSRYVDEIANLNHDPRLPYVGDSAFAHKGGMHVNAVEKNPITFEHVAPESVGNRRRILVSDLSGKSNLGMKAKELGLEAAPEKLMSALTEIKRRENLGYEYELAEASFALLLEKETGDYHPYFQHLGFRVAVEKRGAMDRVSEATVKLKVGEEESLVAAESESGPVNALDTALRKALVPFYPELKGMSLLDYKVRILSGDDGTAAKTRVLIESGAPGKSPWVTVGVSENIIDASYEALVDSVEYALLMHRKNER